MVFQETYLQTDGIEAKIALLKEQYGLVDTTVEGEIKNGFLGLKNIGRCSKNGEGYKIDIFGKDFSDYLIFHEFLHIQLEETGRTFDTSQEDPELSDYLFELRNLFNDFLIETEVNRQFGERYANDVSYTRERDLRGQFTTGGLAASSLSKFMLGFTCRAISEIYPQMRETISGKLFGETMSWPGFEEFIDTVNQYEFSSITPSQYREGIQKLHRCIAGSDISFAGNKVVFDNPNGVKEVIRGYEKVDAQISSLLSAYLGR